MLQLPGKLNEFDGSGDLPLDLALCTCQESIAVTLVKHNVNINMANQAGCCLLHKAIKRGRLSLDWACPLLVSVLQCFDAVGWSSGL